MRLGRLIPFLFLVVLTGTPLLGQQSRFRVLAFYSASAEPDHVHFAQDAVKFFRERAASENFSFESTTKWEDLTDDRLKSYQLVVWLNESRSNEQQRRVFERYMQNGGAWLGFHAAGYNDKDTNWPWYVDFLGGAVFHINSWPPLPARIRVDDRIHPAVTGIPADFESPANEWYVWKPSPRLNKDVRVLATFDQANYPLGFKNVLTAGDLPVVWTNTKYKMLYMNMGHGDKIFTSPIQNQFIDNAVNWLGAGAQPSATPEASGTEISPNGIVLNPQTHKFYAVNTREGTVAVVDGNGRLVSRVKVGSEPEGISVNPRTNRIYVANSGSGSVSVIDGTTDKVIATVPVGRLPYVIAANPATDKVYISKTFSNVMTVIDGRTNTASLLKAGLQADAIAVNSIANEIYMTSYEDPQVTIMNGGDDDRVSKVETGNHLWAIGTNPANNKTYAVSAGSANVTIIDGKSRSTKFVGVGDIPCALAIDSSTGRLFVANYASNSVTVIDGETDAVVATVEVGGPPQAIAVDSAKHTVYVVSPHASTTTVIDGAENVVKATLKTAGNPFAIATDSETHKAVAVGLTGTLTVIDGANGTASTVPDKE